MRLRDYFYLAAIIGLIFLLVKCGKDNERGVEDVKEEVEEYLKQEKEKWKTKEGEFYQKMSQLTLANDKLIEQIDAKDSSIFVLKEAYRAISKELKKREEIETITVIEKRDTIITEGIPVEVISEDPLYVSFGNSDEWHTLTGTYKDSIGLNYTLTSYERIRIAQTIEKTGFLGLGKQRRNILLSTNNPYTVLKTESFTVVDKPKRLAIGPTIGFGLDFKATNQGVNMVGPKIIPSGRFFLGVGLSYSMIRF